MKDTQATDDDIKFVDGDQAHQREQVIRQKLRGVVEAEVRSGTYCPSNWSAYEISLLVNAIDEARAEVERLRAALEFYANPKNWRSTHGNGGGVDDTIVDDCGGEWVAGSRARKALKGES